MTFTFKGYNDIVCETEGTDYNFVSFYVLKPQGSTLPEFFFVPKSWTFFLYFAVFSDYSCAFCLLTCATYKVYNYTVVFKLFQKIYKYLSYDVVYLYVFQGLKCHLQASHGLFDYEFLVGYFHEIITNYGFCIPMEWMKTLKFLLMFCRKMRNIILWMYTIIRAMISFFRLVYRFYIRSSL